MPTPTSGTEAFPYDDFLSHSAKDKAVVRADGLWGWFDEWLLKAGDNVPAKNRQRRFIPLWIDDAH